VLIANFRFGVANKTQWVQWHNQCPRAWNYRCTYGEQWIEVRGHNMWCDTLRISTSVTRLSCCGFGRMFLIRHSASRICFVCNMSQYIELKAHIEQCRCHIQNIRRHAQLPLIARESPDVRMCCEVNFSLFLQTV